MSGDLFRQLRTFLGVVLPRLYLPTHVGLGCIIDPSTALTANVWVGRWSSLYGTQLEGFVKVGAYSRLSNCRVGSYSAVGASARMESVNISRFSYVGPELLAGCGEHPANWIAVSPNFYSIKGQCGTSFVDRNYFCERRPILILSDVWIGARVFLRDGIRIGNGAIVAAGSVVVSDVEDYAVVGGVPARVIKFRFSKTEIAALLELAWWDWPESALRQAAPLFRDRNVAALVRWYESDPSLRRCVTQPA